MHQVKVEHFEGPFDLLLQLIEENKLDITKISLSHITEEYIRILQKKTNEIPPYELADFLVVAAKLLLIKSKALMPYLLWDEGEEEADLESQLRMYREYYEASKKIHKIFMSRRYSYFREKFLLSGDIGFYPPLGVSQERLAAVFREIINELTPLVQLSKTVIRRTINIQEKISRIRDLILNDAQVNFSRILKEAKDKTEIIVSFLALLELMKQKEIAVYQGDNFQEIIIEKV